VGLVGVKDLVDLFRDTLPDTGELLVSFIHICTARDLKVEITNNLSSLGVSMCAVRILALLRRKNDKLIGNVLVRVDDIFFIFVGRVERPSVVGRDGLRIGVVVGIVLGVVIVVEKFVNLGGNGGADTLSAFGARDTISHLVSEFGDDLSRILVGASLIHIGFLERDKHEVVRDLLIDGASLIGNESNMTDGRLLLQLVKLAESLDLFLLGLEKEFLERVNLLAGLLVELLELKNVVGDRRDAHHDLCIDCVYALYRFNLGVIYE
jgi:hypothetical protein